MELQFYSSDPKTYHENMIMSLVVVVNLGPLARAPSLPRNLPLGASTADEVLTRQCPCFGLSIYGAYVGAWRIRRLQTETGGAHEFTQVRPLGG
jgi:hypothetical protein